MTCPLCNRPLGTNYNKHHLIPKTFGGKITIEMHKICHRKLHATFSEREMQHYYNTIEHLCEHEDIQKFIKWVSKKHPDYYSGSDQRKQK